MFENLMHSLMPNKMTISSNGNVGIGAMLGQATPSRRGVSKKIFSGNIEVQQVSNGYVVNIATREGYEYETYIAHTIVEVNEIIASAMVAFQLEK